MRALARIALALAMVAGALRPAAAVERILQFVSDVRVERNGDLRVTETIRVQAEGREIRRGILRDFPTTYHRRDGARVEVGFEVEQVTRGGMPEAFAIERLANGVRVRIGRANVLLPIGTHEYVISYRTTRQIGFFPAYDELYWNATGTGWTFAIEAVEARITLPKRVPIRQSAFYTGPQGARGSDAQVAHQEPGVIVFRTTKPLPPRSGLTVAAAWDKGVVAEPDTAQRARWWLADNLPLVVAGSGLLLLIVYYAVGWLRVGRDPRRGTVIPLFEAPEGLSAAAVRYIWRMGSDNRVFAAAVLDLAVHGHLSLSDRGGAVQLDQRRNGRPIGRAEAAMKTKLFATADRLSLDQSNHEPLGRARDALNQALASAYRGRLFHANTGWAVLGALLWLALFAAIALSLLANPQEDVTAGFLIGTAFASAGGLTLGYVWRSLRRGGSLFNHIFIGGIAAVFTLVGLGLLLGSARGPLELAAFLVPPLAAQLVAFGFSMLKAPTAQGRRRMDEIEGLRQYLGVAEEARLEFMHPPEKTPELFERFLPYAVALDVENTWAQRFAGVLATAATAAAAAGVASWYHGDRDMLSDPAAFAERLGSDLSQTIAAAATPPGSSDSGGSSGSSGGGSSGGGGGGGGGSGW